MIQDIGYAGNIDSPYRWHSVSALRSFQQTNGNNLEDCRKLMRLITEAIDFHCRQICERRRSLEEIQNLFRVYVTLSSYARQIEMDQVRSCLDEKSPALEAEYISVPQYEDELIRNK